MCVWLVVAAVFPAVAAALHPLRCPVAAEPLHHLRVTRLLHEVGGGSDTGEYVVRQLPAVTLRERGTTVRTRLRMARLRFAAVIRARPRAPAQSINEIECPFVVRADAIARGGEAAESDPVALAALCLPMGGDIGARTPSPFAYDSASGLWGPAEATDEEGGAGAGRAVLGVLAALARAPKCLHAARPHHAWKRDHTPGVAAGHTATVSGSVRAHFEGGRDAGCATGTAHAAGDAGVPAWLWDADRVDFQQKAHISVATGVGGEPRNTSLFTVGAGATLHPLCSVWHRVTHGNDHASVEAAIVASLNAEVPESRAAAARHMGGVALRGMGTSFLQLHASVAHAIRRKTSGGGSPLAAQQAVKGGSLQDLASTIGSVSAGDPLKPVDLPSPAGGEAVQRIQDELSGLSGAQSAIADAAAASLDLPRFVAVVNQGSLKAADISAAAVRLTSLHGAIGNAASAVSAGAAELAAIQQGLRAHGDGSDADKAGKAIASTCTHVAAFAAKWLDSDSQAANYADLKTSCTDLRALTIDDLGAYARIAYVSKAPETKEVGDVTVRYGLLSDSSDTDTGVDIAACAALDPFMDMLSTAPWDTLFEFAGAGEVDVDAITARSCELFATAHPEQVAQAAAQLAAGGGSGGSSGSGVHFPDFETVGSALATMQGELEGVQEVAASAYQKVAAFVAGLTSISTEDLGTLLEGVKMIGELGMSVATRAGVIKQIDHRTNAYLRAFEKPSAPVTESKLKSFADQMLTFFLPAAAGTSTMLDEARCLTGIAAAFSGDGDRGAILTSAPEATPSAVPGMVAYQKQIRRAAANGDDDDAGDAEASDGRPKTPLAVDDGARGDPVDVSSLDPVPGTMHLIQRIDGILTSLPPDARSELQTLLTPLGVVLNKFATKMSDVNGATAELWRGLCDGCSELASLCNEAGDSLAVAGLVDKPSDAVDTVAKCLGHPSSSFRRDVADPLSRLRAGAKDVTDQVAKLREAITTAAKGSPAAVQAMMSKLSLVMYEFEWKRQFGSRRTAAVTLHTKLDIRTEPSDSDDGDADASAAALIEVAEDGDYVDLPDRVAWEGLDDLWVSPERADAAATAEARFEATIDATEGAHYRRHEHTPKVHPDVVSLLQMQAQAGESGMSLSQLPRLASSSLAKADAHVFATDMELFSLEMNPYVDVTGIHKAIPVLKVLGIDVNADSLANPQALLKTSAKALLSKGIEIAKSPQLWMAVMEKVAALVGSSRSNPGLPLLDWLANPQDLRDGLGSELYDEYVGDVHATMGANDRNATERTALRGDCDPSATAAERANSTACGATLFGFIMPMARYTIEMHTAAAAGNSSACEAAGGTLVGLARAIDDLMRAAAPLADLLVRGATPRGVSMVKLLDAAAAVEGHWLQRLRHVAYDTSGGPTTVQDAITQARAGLDDDAAAVSNCVAELLHEEEKKTRKEAVAAAGAIEGLAAGASLAASAVVQLKEGLTGGSDKLATLGGVGGNPAWLSSLEKARNEIFRARTQMEPIQVAMQGVEVPGTAMRGAAATGGAVGAAKAFFASPSVQRFIDGEEELEHKMNLGIIIGRAGFGCLTGGVSIVGKGISDVSAAADTDARLKAVRATKGQLDKLPSCAVPSTGPLAEAMQTFGLDRAKVGAKKEREVGGEPVPAYSCDNRLCKGLSALDKLRWLLRLVLRLVERGLMIQQSVESMDAAIKGEGAVTASDAADSIDTALGAVQSTLFELERFLLTGINVGGESPLVKLAHRTQDVLAFVRSVAVTVVTALVNVANGEQPITPAGVATLAVRVFATSLGSKMNGAGFVAGAAAQSIGGVVLRSSNRLMPLGALAKPHEVATGDQMDVFAAVNAHRHFAVVPCMVEVCNVTAEAGDDVAGAADLCAALRHANALLEFVVDGGVAFAHALDTDDSADKHAEAVELIGADAARDTAEALRELLGGDSRASLEAAANSAVLAALAPRADADLAGASAKARDAQVRGAAGGAEEVGAGAANKSASNKSAEATGTGGSAGIAFGDELEEGEEEELTDQVDPATLPLLGMQPCATCLEHAMLRAEGALAVYDAFSGVGEAFASEAVGGKDVEAAEAFAGNSWTHYHAAARRFVSAAKGAATAVPNDAYRATVERQLAEAAVGVLKAARADLDRGAALVRCAADTVGRADALLDTFAGTLQTAVTDIASLDADLKPLSTKILSTLKLVGAGRCFVALQSPPVVDGPSLDAFAAVPAAASGTLEFVGATTNFIRSIAGVVGKLRTVKDARKGASVLYGFWSSAFPALQDALTSVGTVLPKQSRLLPIANWALGLLGRFDVQVRRLATMAMVVDDPNSGLEKLLEENIKHTGLDLVAAIASGRHLQHSLRAVLDTSVRAEPVPFVPAAIGAGVASPLGKGPFLADSVRFAIGVLSAPFLRLAGGGDEGSVQAAVAALTASDAGATLRGKEDQIARSWLDVQRALRPDRVLPLADAAGVIDAIAALEAASGLSPDAASTEAAAAIAHVRETLTSGPLAALAVDWTASEGLADQVSIDLRMAVGNLEPDARALLAAVVARSGSGAGSEGADALADALAAPMLGALEHVRAVLTFLTHYIRLWDGFSGDELRRFAQSGASLGEIARVELVDVARGAATVRGVFGGPCESKADRASAVGAALCPIIGSAMQGVADAADGDSFAAEVGKASARVGAGVAALAQAMDCTMGVGMRGAALASSVKERLDGAPNLDAKVALLEGLNADVDSLLGGRCADALNTSVPDKLIAAGAITEAQRATVHTGAFAKVRSLVTFITDLSRVAMSGATFMDQTKAARATGASPRAKVAIGKAWDMLAAEGTRVLACRSKNGSPLAEAVPPSALGAVKTQAKIMCAAFKYGKPVANTLSNVGADSDMSVKALLVGELLSQTVENVIDGLSSQAVVVTAVVPRLASSVAQKGSSLARALRTLASPTKSGSITAILAELNARYIAPALEAARSTNDTALVAALADVSRLHRHAAVAGRAVGSEAALDVMATLHKEDREGEALAELESSMHPAFAASRAIVATVSVVDGITAAQCDTVVAKMGDEAPFTGAQLQAAVTASTELADALASSAVPLGHVLTAFVSGNPLLMMGTVAGMEAGTKLIAAQQPSPAEMKASMKSAAFAHLVKGLEKLAAAVGRFTAAVEAGDGKEGAESDALAAVVAMCDNCAEFSSVVTLGNDAVAAEGEAAAGGDGDAENSEEEEEADTGASTHPVAVAMAPLLARVASLPTVAVAESENTMVDVASAAHVVAYAQQVAVHAMEVSAQLTQALTPDDLSEAELDALDEEAAEEKAAAQDTSIVDALDLKVEMLQKMAKLAGIAGSLAPQLGSAARRLAVEMRTASSLAPPSEVVQSVNGTLTAVSAIPAVADGAFTTAAAVLTFVSSMDETLKRPDAVRVMMKELDGLSEDLGSRIVAIRRARKPMTGRWATSVKFVEGFLVALEKTLVVVVKSQLTSPPTILVCKGGGAPLAASLTDDKIFSRSLNLLSVPIGPIPVFGVPLSVGLALMLDLEVGLETGTCQFTYMSGAEEHYTAIGLRTGATVAAEATVGLGSTGFSVGLGLKLALAGFTLAPQLDAQPATGNGVLTLTPYITSLQGQIFAFAKFLTYNFRASLYQWAGLRRRLPGPCKALHPERFSTCPSIGPVGVPASGEEIMQELFASTARPKAVLPLSHVLTLVAKNGSGDAVTNPKEGSKGDRKGRSKDGGGKLGLLEEASGSEAKERLSGDAKSARTDRKRRGTKDLGSMMMADEVSGGVRVNAESMGVEGAGMGRDKRTEAEVLGEPTMMVEEGTTLMGDAEDVACTLCYVWSGSVYNSIWCPTPVMRMQYLAGLPNVGEMLEETMDAEGVVSRRLMSDRRRDSILAIGVCNERVQVKSGVPLTLDSKQLSSRTLVYTADVAVEWVAEARLGTEWFRLGYDSEAKLAVVESTDAPSGMASASRGVDAAVKSAFERQVARERRVRGVREAVGLGDAALTSMGVSLPSEVVDQALPMDDAHSPSTKQHVTVDPAVGWTTKRMTDEEEATANAELYVDPPSCGERLENARAKMAKAGKMGAAIAEGIVKMVFKECARDPSAAGASGAVSEEDRYAVSTRRCFRCNFVYDRYLACPLADSRGVAEVDAAKGKLGKRLSPAVSSSPFWEPAQRLLVAQRCLSAYFNRAPNGTESTEERVVRDTLRDVLAMEDSEKVAMAMHVYVCDERVTLDGNYDGWLMLHTSESHMLHFRVPAAAPTACSATLHTMKMVEEYPSLRDRAVAPMAEAAMADAAAVNLARQSCLPEPALPPAALSAALAHPTTDLRSVPSGWLDQSDEFVPSYNPRCLRCTVSSGASSVTCAPEEDERQLRLQTVMGPHAPGVDEEDAVERANRVLDEVAARALRQLVGKASLNDWTVAVCGESTWTMTRSASQANASGSGLSLVELGAKTSTKASTEAGAEVEGIRVRGKEHNTNFSVPNTCEFFCHWSTWKGNSRCGNGLHLDASQVPGCMVRTAGTQLAEPAVAAACKELNPECDSAYSEFSRAIVATSTRNSGPARECVFQCRQKSRVYETGDPCGQQVAVPESEAPGCTVLARDVLVPLTMPWAPKVAALCNAKSTLCDGTRVDYAGSKELTRESLARHEEMHKNKCIFSCKGCGFSVSVPEVLAPGCSNLDVGEQIENEALKRVCQQRTPPDQQCPKGNGVFVGMEDDTSADYVGGYICMGRRGQVTCGRYVADYAPLWPMYRDGQAKVHAEVVSASGTLHEPIYFAFDKLIAGVAYGDVEDTDYAVTDPCPRVPPPDDE